MSSPTIYRHDFPDTAPPNPDALRLADIPPPWRQLTAEPTRSTSQKRSPRPMDPLQARRGQRYRAEAHEARMVNAALMLRRPLLITGPAGVGKTSLAYSVAWQLGLGNVLRWGITSRSTLKDALYHYDAIARLHDASLQEKKRNGQPASIGDFLTLGPLGTALLPTRTAGYFPRVLLIDEIDKSDADLPSDLLHVLEEGSFSIPEIARLPDEERGGGIRVKTADRNGHHATADSSSSAPGNGNGSPAASPASSSSAQSDDHRVPLDPSGVVRSDDFPFIIMTSNGERDFPPAFLRRCLQLKIGNLTEPRLLAAIEAHLGLAKDNSHVQELLKRFHSPEGKEATNATDQLLNALFIMAHPELDLGEKDRESLMNDLLHSLTASPQVG